MHPVTHDPRPRCRDRLRIATAALQRELCLEYSHIWETGRKTQRKSGDIAELTTGYQQTSSELRCSLHERYARNCTPLAETCVTQRQQENFLLPRLHTTNAESLKRAKLRVLRWLPVMSDVVGTTYLRVRRTPPTFALTFTPTAPPLHLQTRVSCL